MMEAATTRGLERDALIERFLAVRELTERLAAPLSAEDQLMQSMPSASPTKWHRAHTTWFFETFVLRPLGVAAVDLHNDYLWNSYYEAVGARHPRLQRGLLSRPSLDEVAAYRREVDGRVESALARLSDAQLEVVRPVMLLGLAHEEQHQELILTDILHALSLSPLSPAYRKPLPMPPGNATPGEAANDARFVSYGGGLVEVGHVADGGFSFDNEGPRHRVWLEPFQLADRPVTVGEVRGFMDEGGYSTPSLWLSEGWDWVRREAITAPLYWRLRDGQVRDFTLEGERDLDDAEPASHLSYFEADAVARFLGARLPTEFEWEHAVGDAAQGQFLDLDRPMRPTVWDGAAPMGAVWVWTRSAYAPYPGYAAGAGALGEYNGKFMVNQLVLRGGSCFTPPGHARPSYRNFWYPDTRFQMTGLRLARDA